MNGISRRSFLAVTGAGAAAVTLAGCNVVSTSSVSEPDAYDTALPIPPLAESEVIDGVRTFRITAQPGTTEFRPDVDTPTWGWDGAYGGPTMRAAVGERVAVEVTNGLDEATSAHWHGMHLPPDMDGGPHQMIVPGDTWRAEWLINQAPCTLWYHPHPHGATERHVYRGLAGLFYLDPAPGSDEAAVYGQLPHTYGVDDIPVVISDKRLSDGGELVFDDGGNEVGLLGNVVTVNGVTGAVLRVSTERVRLRLLNASTARTYSLGLPGRTFQLVATDGGLLRGPVELEKIRLSPGERAEVVVAMEPGEQVMLHSFEPDLGNMIVPFAVGANDEFDVLRIEAEGELSSSEEVPGELTAFGQDPEQATVRREFRLSGRQINDARMDMARIDETVEVGTTEIWTVINDDPSPHNFHVHDVQFEVISVGGSEPSPELRGRKDTVYLEPGRAVELLMTFEDYADPQWPYMYHCHLLRHEDEGLMGQFVVVNPGERADPSMIAGHAHH
ncbi:multicopper oxidase family protein [Ruania halotolerans]|uniref:multicopper oxidase family protein n=1 Tax=Ruania halotolerans TaxID=2897773 RepID=UPI001E432F93|nr:multicopper oxidase domain-containing protein [Ruania halotolerans]UFU06412.1 multicopper oxidase domain-containing protein [Ruania halotolerans]